MPPFRRLAGLKIVTNILLSTHSILQISLNKVSTSNNVSHYIERLVSSQRIPKTNGISVPDILLYYSLVPYDSFYHQNIC